MTAHDKIKTMYLMMRVQVEPLFFRIFGVLPPAKIIDNYIDLLMKRRLN